ncbi:hypothetical protein [Kitasatospora sp. NPDC059160]|uniref:hypothetical protein n=1 Tax=Kitasatospora sp. NPDC059160 TaxID=3346748 RepID=UPI0036900B65
MSEYTPNPTPGPADDQPGKIDMSKHFTVEQLAELETAMQTEAELSEAGRAGATVGTLVEPTAPAPHGWLRTAAVRALPEWALNTETLAGVLRQQRDMAAYRIIFHGMRTPVYAARIAVLTGHGTRAATHSYLHHALAWEYNDAIRSAKKARDGARVLQLRTEKSDVSKDRVTSRRFVAASAMAGLGITTAVVTAMVGAWIVAGPLLATIAATLATLGYRDKTQGSADVAADVYRFLDALPADHGPVTDERIDAALRTHGLLRQDEQLRPYGPVDRDKNGATTHRYTLPSRIIAADIIAKRQKIAGSLGLSAEQMDIAQDGPENQVSIWCAKKVPFSDAARTSPLVAAKQWSVWDLLPFGVNRRGAVRSIQLLWSSMLFGGAQGFGKTSAMRVPAAAVVLDPHAQVLLADFKGGADWEALEEVATEVIIGADPTAVHRFVGLVDKLIDEMDRRFGLIRSLPKKLRPEMRLTPKLAAEHGMPVLALIIDEIQEAFGALLAMSEGKKEFDALVEKLARLIRRGRACGLIVIAAAQRPDAKSVPTAFRDVILKRYSVHTVDDTSSDMILGDGMAKRGHSAAGLGIIGVGVLAEEAGAERVQVDRITPEQFEEICLRGRELRIQASTLAGYAARGIVQAGSILHLLLQAFETAAQRAGREVEEIGTYEVLDLLGELDPKWARPADVAEATHYGRMSAALAKEIASALRNTERELKTGDVTNLAGKAGKGYTLAALRLALAA